MTPGRTGRRFKDGLLSVPRVGFAASTQFCFPPTARIRAFTDSCDHLYHGGNSQFYDYQEAAMRAEAQKLVESIEEALDLLRRHL